MPRVIVECDERWPVWYTYTPTRDVPGERYVDVPDAQLSYWDMVEREWDRVQKQMATARCAATGHKGGDRPAVHDCLTCSPPEVVEP